MKTWHRYWRNLHYKIFQGMAFLWPCLVLSAFGQTTPIPAPEATVFPGMVEQFEKLTQLTNDRFANRQKFLVKNGRTFTDATAVSNLDLEPDFLNSVILHSNSGYLKLASVNKCGFYDAILTDLLRSSEGKIQNVHVTYLDPEGNRQSATVDKKDFLNKVVNSQCPESRTLIDQFQISNLDRTLKAITFESPTGVDHCRNLHLAWLHNPKTPYLCQIHEYLNEVRNGEGNAVELAKRRAVAQVLERKLSPTQQDYLDNLCSNLDTPKQFCSNFLTTSFWNKVSNGFQDKIFAADVCRTIFPGPELSSPQLKQCLNRLTKEEDLCLYPAGRSSGILPQPNCELISTALNHSGLRSNYRDCPQSSDHQGITNLSRVVLHLNQEPIASHGGQCSAISAGVALNFYRQFDNEESWGVEACYDDKVREREVCLKTYFGEYAGQPESITNVVARILKATRGADSTLTCKLVDAQDYNPLLLEYKSGCYVVYDRLQCYTTNCRPRVIYNDRPIDLIRFKGLVRMDYFPTNVREERFSQHYILTHDFKRKGRSLTSLNLIKAFFKTAKGGIIHGVGCAEILLPSFFQTHAMNQCTPLPFIIDGMIEKDQVVFVTRTAVDSLQAPRLISWSSVLSAVKSYQIHHPLRLWTMYGIN